MTCCCPDGVVDIPKACGAIAESLQPGFESRSGRSFTGNMKGLEVVLSKFFNLTSRSLRKTFSYIDQVLNAGEDCKYPVE